MWQSFNYKFNVILNLTVPILIIIGGLGFTVHYNILSVLKGYILKIRAKRAGLFESPPVPLRMSLHSKIVLTTTLTLIILGIALFYAMEYNGALKDMPFGGRIMVSFFQSVTPRTAGFNTVDYSTLKSCTLFFTMMLMFIGASPGSTGGGIKTATFAVLFLSIVSILRKQQNVELRRKSIPPSNVNQAVVVTFLALAFVCLAILALSVVEEEKGLSFLQLAFETVSAFGTVGLSTGITGELSSAAKLILIIMMFIGRVGPLGLALALSGRIRLRNFDYPTERVIIG